MSTELIFFSEIQNPVSMNSVENPSMSSSSISESQPEEVGTPSKRVRKKKWIFFWLFFF